MCNSFRIIIMTLLMALGMTQHSWAACTSPAGVAGTFDYFTAQGTYKYCDGTNWVSMKSGGISLVNQLSDPSPYGLINPYKVLTNGSYSYVIDSNGAVLVVDISNLANPTPVGIVRNSLLSGATDLALSGTYLVVSANGKVVIVNVTTPSTPTISGSVTVSSIANIYVSGNYAYGTNVSASPGKLFTIDISNKSAPTLTSTLSDASIALCKAVAASGGYAYIAGNTNQITVVDVSAPSTPAIVGTLNDVRMNNLVSLEVSGNYVHAVSTGSPGNYSIIDVTTKTAPTFLSSLSISASGLSVDITLNDSVAYIGSIPNTSSTGYITTVDISLLTEPKKILSYSVLGSGATGARSISTSGKKLTILDSNYFLVTFDVALKPTIRPQADGYIRDKTLSSSGFVAVDGNYAAILDGVETLFIVDVSNPASIVYKGQITMPGTVNVFGSGLAMKGSYVYATNSNWGRISVINITDPTNPVIEKSLINSNWSAAGGLLISGNYLISTNSSGISIFDITTPSNPTFVGKHTGSAGMGQRLAIVGNTVYMTTNTSQLAIYDITNKAAPTYLGKVTDTTALNGAQGVAVSGNYAYVATVNCGCVAVIDISTPSTPTLVNSVTNATYYGVLEDVAVVGGYLYTISYSKPVAVSSLSTPTAPSPTSSLASSGNALFLSGSILYTAHTTSMSAINVATPSTPSITGTVSPTGRLDGIAGIAASGNYTYTLSATQRTFVVIDTSTSTAPRIVANIADTTKFAAATKVVVSGTYAYVLSPNYLTIIDISTPTSPTIVGFLNDATNLPTPKDLIISGTYAYVAASNRFTVVNITNKAAPTYAANVAHANISDCRKMVLSGSNVFMACYATNSLVAVSVATPTSPAVVGSLVDATNLLNAATLAISGNYAFVGASPAIATVDISTPASPTLIKTVPVTGVSHMALKGTTLFFYGSSPTLLGQANVSTPLNFRVGVSGLSAPVAIGAVKDIAISGNYLVRASSSNTFDIWNIADTTSAIYQDANYSMTTLLTDAYRMKIVGTKAYVTGRTSNRLTILDISNIDSPTILGSIADTRFDGPTGVEVSGNYAYLLGAGGGSVLSVVDISNPASPQYVTKLSDASYFSGGETLQISGSYLYVGNVGMSRVSSIDISSPASPVMKNSLALASGIVDMDISGSYLYACAGNSITVVNISNPLALSLTTTFTDASLASCQALRISGSYIYAVGSTNKTFAVIDITTPTAPAIVGSLSGSNVFSGTNALKVSGNYAYVANFANGLAIVDITNKTAPVLNDSLTGSFGFGGIYYSSNRLLTANRTTHNVSTYQIIPTVSIGSCATAGTLDYNTTLNVMSFCNGTNFISMGPTPGAGGAGCTSPSKPVGTIEYFTGVNKLRYCDGSAWVNLGN